ncbi:MAG: DUF885 family protein [Bacillota bacterium]
MTEKELTRVYRRFDWECASISDRVRSSRDYEPELFAPTLSAKDEVLRSLNSLLARAAALPAPDPVFQILKRHFDEYLKGQISALESRYQQPSQFIGGITRFIGFIGRKDSRFAEERSFILERRLGQVDELWCAIRDLLPTLPVAKVRELVKSCETLSGIAQLNAKRVPEHYAGLPDYALDRVAASLSALSDKATSWAREAHTVAEARDGQGNGASTAHGVPPAGGLKEGLGVERYAEILSQERGVDLGELLEWHEEEVDKTREEMFDIAARINLGQERIPRTVQGVVDALNKYAGPAKDAAEMFARCRDYLARARNGLKGYVNMPEEVCRVVPMEEEGRAQNPWGGYRGGCPRRRPLLGEMVLNPDNVPAITDGWIKINAVHETYPGHHVQFLRATTDPLPETVKEGARSTPLMEGTALRSERVFEFDFPEDPFYPLFVAYRRHHTATRIKADLYLYYFNRTADDATQLYMDELAFDRATARGQVLAQELQPGYFTTYYYGLKRLTDLQAKYGYDDKSYTEMLFAPCRISLENFEAFLALTEADRKRFLTQFPSMMQF